MRRLLANAVGAGLVALTLIWVGAPAQAAACEYGKGVTVVVQGEGLNGKTCVPGGAGKSAWVNLQSAGYSVTSVRGQAGTLCQINGKPAINKCWELDSYWGLFHANGTGGGWAYSQTGVTSLSVGEGGWIGLKFQNSNTRTAPSGTPVGPKPAPAPKPQPTKKPSAKPSTKPSAKPSASQTSPSATASPSATPTSQASKNSAQKAAQDPDDAEQLPNSVESGDTDRAANETVLASTTADDDGGPGLWTFAAIALIVGAAGLLGWRAWRRR